MSRNLYPLCVARAKPLVCLILVICGSVTSNWSGMARGQEKESNREFKDAVASDDSASKPAASQSKSAEAASKLAPLANSHSPTWVVTIAGLGGDERQSGRFKDAVLGVQKVARERWGVSSDRLLHVPMAKSTATAATEPSASEPGTAEPSTSEPDASVKLGASREDVAHAFTRIAEQAGPMDPVWIFVFAHGNHKGRQTFLHLTGPDAPPTLWREWLDKLGDREVVVVLAGSASGWMIKPLTGARRVILTATAADDEFNATEFPLAFVEAASLPLEKLDDDRDGHVSIAELFVATSAAVERRFADDGRIATEHAQLEDDGDGQGTEADAIRLQLTARRRPETPTEQPTEKSNERSVESAPPGSTSRSAEKINPSGTSGDRRDGRRAVEWLVPFQKDVPPAADAAPESTTPETTTPETTPTESSF